MAREKVQLGGGGKLQEAAVGLAREKAQLGGGGKLQEAAARLTERSFIKLEWA